MEGSSKIKLSFLDKMMKAHLTSAECDFLLRIAMMQDSTGMVRGVYYKDICTDLDISTQTYYDIVNALVKKGLIKWMKPFRPDRDIYLVGNNFTTKHSYREGYIKANYTLFGTEEFRSMTAGAKLLAIDCLRLYNTNHSSYIIGVEKFFDKYTKMFGVKLRSIRRYITEIKQFFSVEIKGKLHYITPKAASREEATYISENDRCYMQLIRAACHREKIDFENMSEKDISDVLTIIRQYRQFDKEVSVVTSKGVIKKSFVDYLLDAIRDSVVLHNQDRDMKSKWHRSLMPSFIHKLLVEKLKTAGMLVEA